jgi:predicted lysophospholipase L1 biosynthesis ABC-type transport system permease subunit
MQENVEESLLEMHLDYDGGNILRETVRWSRFLSIVGFVGAGLFILVMALLGNTLMTIYSRMLPGIEAFAGIIIVAFLLLFGILGVMAWMLYRFSSLTRKGIEMQDQAIFTQGLKSLKVYFLISGIFAILGLLFNLFSLTSLIRF